MDIDYMNLDYLYDTEDYLYEIADEIENLNRKAKELGLTEITENWMEDDGTGEE